MRKLVASVTAARLVAVVIECCKRKNMIAIEVEGCDCCPYTHSVWINPDLPKSTKIKDLGLESKDFADDREPEKLIAALRKQGFKKLDLQILGYGGNY
jgi:hypothetical protein